MPEMVILGIKHVGKITFPTPDAKTNLEEGETLEKVNDETSESFEGRIRSLGPDLGYLAYEETVSEALQVT